MSYHPPVNIRRTSPCCRDCPPSLRCCSRTRRRAPSSWTGPRWRSCRPPGRRGTPPWSTCLCPWSWARARWSLWSPHPPLAPPRCPGDCPRPLSAHARGSLVSSVSLAPSLRAPAVWRSRPCWSPCCWSPGTGGWSPRHSPSGCCCGCHWAERRKY